MLLLIGMSLSRHSSTYSRADTSSQEGNTHDDQEKEKDEFRFGTSPLLGSPWPYLMRQQQTTFNPQQVPVPRSQSADSGKPEAPHIKTMLLSYSEKQRLVCNSTVSQQSQMKGLS